MLTLALERLDINVALTPEFIAMPSPTIATMDIPSRREMEPIVERDISNSKASLMASTALLPSFSGTATVILDSELACVMMRTLIPWLAIAPMNFSTTLAPPIAEAPSNDTSAVLSTDVMPLMGTSPLLERQFFTLPLSPTSLRLWHLPWMTVPSNAGLKILRTYTGMLSSMQGTMALGCKTCAPKYASSIASSYLREAMGKASGTRRGSAV
mmetsp:Transcript_28890/g.67778  ORF Transcript_28890/g.67778 Transcript_28890/m.67778 type:complete len:212 (-) Transcript_28890:708-1343(-)